MEKPSVFAFRNYRAYLKDIFGYLRETEPGFTMSEFCRHHALQNSHLSKVLGGTQEINSDSSFRVANGLGLANDEVQYFLLLIEISRCASLELKASLSKMLDEIQEQAVASERFLQSEFIKPELQNRFIKYYLEPIHLIIHMALLIPRYRDHLEGLRWRLKMEQKAFQESVAYLAQIGLIRFRTETEIEVLNGNLFLKKDSVFKTVHQRLMKSLIMETVQLIDDEKKKSMCITFASNEVVAQWFKKRLMELMQELEQRIVGQTAEELYQINFDLFSWTKD